MICCRRSLCRLMAFQGFCALVNATFPRNNGTVRVVEWWSAPSANMGQLPPLCRPGSTACGVSLGDGNAIVLSSHRGVVLRSWFSMGCQDLNRACTLICTGSEHSKCSPPALPLLRVPLGFWLQVVRSWIGFHHLHPTVNHLGTVRLNR